MATLGSRLKELREGRGLTVREVGDEVGVSWTQISRYERDAAVPRPKVLIKLGVLFRVTLEYLREGRTPEDEWREMEAKGVKLSEPIELDLSPELLKFILERTELTKRSFNDEIIETLKIGFEADKAAKALLSANKKLTGATAKEGMAKAFNEVVKQTEDPLRGKGPRPRKKKGA